MLEKYTDKKKILETYLNIIEYGKGIFGIEAATNYYFKKKPAQVSAREAAFLAMLLPSPKKYSRSFVKKSLTPFANRMIESILLKMKQGGYIGEEEYLNELGAHFSWEQVKMDPSEKMSNESSEEIFEEGSESEE
jgi:monofunctional biosynthetic peptidoglycan transglycosylase